MVQRYPCLESQSGSHVEQKTTQDLLQLKEEGKSVTRNMNPLSDK